jgi:uncharacterized membrane protein YphA (DoxX/SURF4 family)
VLRTAIGITALIEGSLYLSSRDSFTPAACAVAIPFLAAGVSLVIGFLTPVAGLVATVGNFLVVLEWLPASRIGSFGTELVAMEMIVLGISISLLGPGAFSLDARLFGRREIVIPPAARPPEY